MPKLKAYFRFTSQQRAGIFILILIIIGSQIAFHLLEINIKDDDSLEKQQWLSLQGEIDTLKLKKKTSGLGFILSIQILLLISKVINSECQLLKSIVY